jgi:hypothetical protein
LVLQLEFFKKDIRASTNPQITNNVKKKNTFVVLSLWDLRGLELEHNVASAGGHKYTN